MAGNGIGRYTVVCASAIRSEIRRLHRRAVRQGRGPAVVEAFRGLVKRLERDPFQVGEPTYRLPELRMLVCAGVVCPLLVHFAIAEDRPLVFIKAVILLRQRDT